MSEYSINKLDPENFQVLLPLMKDCFGMDVNIDYFKWKFLENPAGPFIGFTAVCNKTDEVVAYFGFIPESYKMDGIDKIIFQAHDLMTHSNHRRKGLFKKVNDACLNYIEENHELFVFAFGGAHSTPGFLKWGWKNPVMFHYLFYPKLFCHFSSWKKLKKDCFLEIDDLMQLEHLIGHNNNGKIHSNRSIEHAAWRYRNPLNSYRVIAYKNDGVIQGYVCYYLQNNKIYLFDHVFTNESSKNALLFYLKKQVVTQKLKGIVLFCKNGGKVNSMFRKSGFINNPFNFGPLNTKTPIIFNAKSPDLQKYASAEDWTIDSYDHDSL